MRKEVTDGFSDFIAYLNESAEKGNKRSPSLQGLSSSDLNDSLASSSESDVTAAKPTSLNQDDVVQKLLKAVSALSESADENKIATLLSTLKINDYTREQMEPLFVALKQITTDLESSAAGTYDRKTPYYRELHNTIEQLTNITGAIQQKWFLARSPYTPEQKQKESNDKTPYTDSVEKYMESRTTPSATVNQYASFFKANAPSAAAVAAAAAAAVVAAVVAAAKK
ncbi:MAG: hypothetical protein NTZ67_01650 [Gammaproteobacteria bacterium]|nr:hypothetical protein [Gammaproteobacteria bacterium]